MISYDRMQAVGTSQYWSSEGVCIHRTTSPPTPYGNFEGLRMDEDEDRKGVGWRCYCGIPEHAYLRDGTEIRPYTEQIYLVFVNEDRIAYNWRWEKSEPDNPRFPILHQERFKRQLL